MQDLGVFGSKNEFDLRFLCIYTNRILAYRQQTHGDYHIHENKEKNTRKT